MLQHNKLNCGLFLWQQVGQELSMVDHFQVKDESFIFVFGLKTIGTKTPGLVLVKTGVGQNEPGTLAHHMQHPDRGPQNG